MSDYRLGRVSLFLLACFLTSACLVFWRLPTVRRFHPPSPKPARPKNASIISAQDMGITQEEWDRLRKACDWPGPDGEITRLDQSTSPVHTTFSVEGLNDTYKVGDTIRVTITARDHNNTVKSYGGDFFRAKLLNLTLKAGVYGEVVDHSNGTYTVDFLLPWEGQAQVDVFLIISSEGVHVLNKYFESKPHIRYHGYFEGPGADGVKIVEKVECNVKWGSAHAHWSKANCCCEYKDVQTGSVWQCERPRNLSCDYWVYHEHGEHQFPATPFERQLFSRKLTNVGIAAEKHIITVLPNASGIGEPERCRPGLTTPVPAGFYFQDVWKSFVCNTRRFNSQQRTSCLSNKILHFLGDSTTRQYFEFLERNVPGLKRMNLYTHHKNGPLMAVELKNNIIMHWRTHGFPLRFPKMPASDLHYISTEMDYITGGRETVVVFTFSAHMTLHPLTLYIHRVAKIREAVLRLLKRSPETTVIIKSGNTGLTAMEYGNEWYTRQLNTVMREMFSDIDNVIYMDVWQMTSCHYTHVNIHPGNVIISNEIDMILSFVCPS
ncbi:NXPE family member 3-like isoform X2 [Triplophysa rosa]|uniref:NXPE family member 3-like isoform X2 n=1 Tax=Triplophysa rosa TaxID=992332 RepID=UPI002545F5CA|nr:NXPE family member 3-like isoform X2 [Triplophysa rosa]